MAARKKKAKKAQTATGLDGLLQPWRRATKRAQTKNASERKPEKETPHDFNQ